MCKKFHYKYKQLDTASIWFYQIIFSLTQQHKTDALFSQYIISSLKNSNKYEYFWERGTQTFF